VSMHSQLENSIRVIAFVYFILYTLVLFYKKYLF